MLEQFLFIKNALIMDQKSQIMKKYNLLTRFPF